MPHFILDCSETIITQQPVDETLQLVHDTAESTGLFRPGDIKVRMRSYEHHYEGGTKKDFIHVFGNIMEGRTTEQKADLSRRIVTVLKSRFPDVPIISMNVREFEKATYCNRSMLPE